MPSTPKFCYVAREIRVVEVTHQFDAKEFGSTDCDVRVTGEISVYLEGEEYCGKKQGTACLCVVGSPYLVHISGAIIGYDDFLKQTPQDLTHTIYALVVREPTFSQELRQKVCGSFDRSGDELREESDKRKEGDDVFGWFYLFAINVDGVAEGLESVERDSYRKDDFDEQAIRRDSEQLAELACEEIVVFEDG